MTRRKWLPEVTKSDTGERTLVSSCPRALSALLCSEQHVRAEKGFHMYVNRQSDTVAEEKPFGLQDFSYSENVVARLVVSFCIISNLGFVNFTNTIRLILGFAVWL